MIQSILLVFSFVLLALAAFNVPTPPRFNLGWAGLSFYVLSILLTNVHIH